LEADCSHGVKPFRNHAGVLETAGVSAPFLRAVNVARNMLPCAGYLLEYNDANSKSLMQCFTVSYTTSNAPRS